MDIYLDFDGVICNSFEECFYSSALAWQGISITQDQPPLPDLGSRYLADFRSCRPFIRSGEDYVVLHQALEGKVLPRSQGEFDALLLAAGQEKLAAFKDRLYQTREALLRFHKGLWMLWNPLYPGMEGVLTALALEENVRILSTKKAQFIQEILSFNGVKWPMERIIYTGTQSKLSLIDQVSGFSPSLLIDDQIDHLDFSHPHCDCRLALWGFIKAEWVTPQVPSLSLEQALELLWSFS